MAPLIVYFSRAGENYVDGSIRELSVGNTEVAAKLLHQAVGGTLFRLEQKVPYSHSYRACVEQAKRDWQTGARPELAAWLEEGVVGYDPIYLAYPNYCGTLPMPVCTFLEHYDFSGKTIYPLCTNEGSGMGSSERDLKKICAGATVEKGLSIHGAEAAQSRDRVETWVKSAV